jgi:hypothetical protein
VPEAAIPLICFSVDLNPPDNPKRALFRNGAKGNFELAADEKPTAGDPTSESIVPP